MKKKLKHHNWLSSEEARKNLRVSSCELAHLRAAGELPYQKVGNAYRYETAGVRNLRKKKDDASS